MFIQKGFIVIKLNSMSEEQILDLSLDSGADNINFLEGEAEIDCTAQNLEKVTSYFSQKGFEILTSSVISVATEENQIELNEEDMITFNTIIEELDDHDDVQQVIHNVKNMN
eukprot:TRINITY_DN4943_c1_g1_i1.p2 TRINITY_DN4943_c1_g1~~TRINITY_DN4943_c1_g1_i1.p2  ORF type:complete len:112 (+),score=44.48 TRINITY_DN4943_c1_g1_i1:571-906(+)